MNPLASYFSKRSRRRLLQALLLVAATALPATAGATDHALGRLFMTAAERELLQQQRLSRPPDTPPPAPAALQLNGIIVPASAAATLWVNGQPRQVRNGQVLEQDLSLQVSPRQPATVRLRPLDLGAAAAGRISSSAPATLIHIGEPTASPQISIRRTGK